VGSERLSGISAGRLWETSLSAMAIFWLMAPSFPETMIN
jgi:hypothetical protein